MNVSGDFFRVLRSRIDLAVLALRGKVPKAAYSADALHRTRTELARVQAQNLRLTKALARALGGSVSEPPSAPRSRAGQAQVPFVAFPCASDDAYPRRTATSAKAKKSASALNDKICFCMPEPLLEVARQEEFVVVDVGAQMLESADHVYSSLVAAIGGRIVGFEPLTEERNKRLSAETSVTILPEAIGLGDKGLLRTTRFNPASSLFVPNQKELAVFHALPEMLEVVDESPISTKCLDDIAEAADCRFLKIDVQGGELDVLRGAGHVLGKTLALFVEVEFLDIYEKQPLFCDVDRFLKERGFELIDLLEPGYGSYRASPDVRLRSRLLWADALYVRRLDSKVDWTEAQLLQLACVAHFIGNKFDYAHHVINACDERFGTQYSPIYRASLREAIKREDNGSCHGSYWRRACEKGIRSVRRLLTMRQRESDRPSQGAKPYRA